MATQSILIKQPPLGFTITEINVGGVLNLANSFQVSGPLGIPAAPASAPNCVLECVSFSMTNYLGIETQASTVGDGFSVTKTYLNEFAFGDSASGGTSPQTEYNPLVLSINGGMKPYDGTTDYAGSSGNTITTTWTYDPSQGNVTIFTCPDNTAALTVIAFMEESVRGPATGTLLTLGWTTYRGIFRYYYI